MSLILADISAKLIDFDGTISDPLATSIVGKEVKYLFGILNDSGTELDRQNLLNLFATNPSGGNPILRFKLGALPSEKINFNLSIVLQRSIYDNSHGTPDQTTNITIPLEITQKSDESGVWLITPAVQPTKSSVSARATLSPGYDGIKSWPFSFEDEFEFGRIYRTDSDAVAFDFYLLRLIEKNASIAELYELAKGIDRSNMLDVENYFIQFGFGNQVFTDSVGGSVNSFGIGFPIDDRLTANQAPQLQVILDQILHAGVPKHIALSAPDPDGGDTVAYSVIDDSSAGKIAVGFDGDTMRLTSATDYTASVPVRLTIKAVDDKGAFTTQTFSVTVEPPADLPATYWGATEKPLRAGVPAKSVTSADKAAISLVDGLTALKSLLGQSTLTGYAASAADFDSDGTFSLADVVGIVRTVLPPDVDVPPDDFPVWMFVPAQSNPVAYVGILKGDVDGSWFPAEG